MADESTRELTTAPPTEVSAHRAMEQFDLADDAKILKEFSKRVIKEFTYKVNGRYDLSSVGTNWACREYAKQGEVLEVIGFPLVERCPFDQDYVNITVKVQRSFVNPATGLKIALDSAFGHKRMCRKTKRYLDESDDSKFELIEDPEFITKAITKAERNGKKKLLPKDVIANLVARATGQPPPGPPQAKNVAKPGPAKPTAPPAGSAPPATQSAKPEEKKATASSPQSPTPPTQPSGPTSAAAAPSPTPPASGDQAAKPKMTKDVMVQKLDAVCKLVFQTQDGAVARQRLAAITGKASPADLSEEEIKTIGNAINAVAKKTAVIEGNNIVKIADKSILWKGPELPPPQEAPPEAEGDMF